MVVGFLLIWLLIIYVQVFVFAFLERKAPSHALGWLLLLLIVPVIGFLLYLLIRIGIRRAAQPLDKATPVDAHVQSVELFFEGEQLYTHLFHRLRDAIHQIHIAFFIIREDKVGEEFKDILINKARSGCMVRLLYDAVGSSVLSKKYIGELQAAGIQICAFQPLRFPWITGRINRRYHRKMVIIDDSSAYIGGFNIGKEYIGEDPKLGYWRDSHALLQGEGVIVIQQLFCSDWKLATGRAILPNQDALRKNNDRIRTKLFWSGPNSSLPESLHQILSFLYSAKQYVWIATPYLVPDQALLTALQARARAGIEIKILLPQKADHLLVYFASLSYVEDLLSAGVQIYLFQAGFMHSKLMIADDEAIVIGSSNFDMRSFFLNYELSAIVYDQNTVQVAKHQYMSDLQHSHKIDINEYQQRGFGSKVLEAVCRLYASLM